MHELVFSARGVASDFKLTHPRALKETRGPPPLLHWDACPGFPSNGFWAARRSPPWGLAALVFVVRQAAAPNSNIDILAFLAGWVAGGTAIGAGAFFPFRLTMLGTLIGFVVQVILFFVLVIAKS